MKSSQDDSNVVRAGRDHYRPPQPPKLLAQALASSETRTAFRIRTVNWEDMLSEVQTERRKFHGSPSLDYDEADRLPQEPRSVHSMSLTS